jgi:hypothetical protein
MNMQWSGIEAAGITKTVIATRTAVTNLIVRANFHSTDAANLVRFAT